MPLPASWIEHLFGKLTIRYGVAFTRQWPDADLELVKADWAEVLGGFDGPSIAYGLRYLPTEKPPTALQFRDICRRAPSAEPARIEHTGRPADPQRVAQIVAELAAPKADDMTPAERVAAGLQARLDRGEKLTEAQRTMLQMCRLRGVTTETPGAFKQVPVDCLPPAMRVEASA